MADLYLTLYSYAKGDCQRIAQLRQWQTEAITKIANNQGKDIVSTTANGVSVSFSSAENTSINDWFAAITSALTLIEKGGPRRKITGRLA